VRDEVPLFAVVAAPPSLAPVVGIGTALLVVVNDIISKEKSVVVTTPRGFQSRRTSVPFCLVGGGYIYKEILLVFNVLVTFLGKKCPKKKKKSERIIPRVKSRFFLVYISQDAFFHSKRLPKKRRRRHQTLSKISFSSRRAFDVLGRPFVPFFRQKAPRSREREREREDDIIARAVRPVVVVVVVVPTARKRRAREIDRGSRAESPLFFFFFFDDDDDDAASATKF